MRCANGIKTSCNLVSGRANGLIRCPQTANLRNMKRAETNQEDIQSLARAHAADAIAVLAEIMNNPDAPAGARLSAAKALLDRGWGKAGAKPPEDGNRAAPVSQIRRVIVDPRQHNAKRPSQPANAASLRAHSTKLIGIPVAQARSGGQRARAAQTRGAPRSPAKPMI